jgi:hypothetical protein
MGKTIIVNEKIMHTTEFKEVALASSLPKELKRELNDNTTPLSSNPSFPEESGDSFEKRLALRRFKETKDELYRIGIIDDEIDVENLLPSLIEKCKRLEEPIRRNLEKVAYNFIIETFNVPEGVINLVVELTDTIDDSTLNVRVQAEESEYEYEDVEHKRKLTKEIHKRRLLNGLISGAALRFATNIKKYLNAIYELEPKLPELYRNIIALNEYLLFNVGKIEINDKKKNQLGVSYITIGNEITKTNVQAEAVIFPILIYELIKAFLEISIAHGLPSSREEAHYVMGKCDYMQAEPWYMRIGPAMYDIFQQMLGETDDQMLPFIFMEISKLPNDLFEIAMQEIFCKTKKGKKILQRIKEKHENQQDYEDFSNRMQLANTAVSMISEQCIENDISEEERKYLIKEAIMQLNEISVRDARLKHYQDIPEKDWIEIVQKLQGNDLSKLEGETKWALGLYRKKSPRFMEDLYKLHQPDGIGYLDIFKRLIAIHKLQGNEGNLYQYKSISELGAFVTKKMEEIGDEEIWGDNAYRKKRNMSDAQKEAKDDIIVQYEDDEWIVITPNSYEASVYWGDGTEWCTAYKDDDYYYKSYSSKGPLYINIDKFNDSIKYQFHFETDSFMDEYDSEIKPPIMERINATDGLRDFYKKIVLKDTDNPENYFRFFAEENEYGVPFDIYQIGKKYWFYNTEEGDAKCLNGVKRLGWGGWESLEGMYAQDWRDYVHAVVDHANKFNFINGYGDYISIRWFDDIGEWEVEYCYIPVKLNGKWGIMGNYGGFEIQPQYDNIVALRDEDGWTFNGYKATVNGEDTYISPEMRTEPYNPEIHGDDEY